MMWIPWGFCFFSFFFIDDYPASIVFHSIVLFEWSIKNWNNRNNNYVIKTLLTMGINKTRKLEWFKSWFLIFFIYRDEHFFEKDF